MTFFATDSVLACASCGLRYLVPGGQLVAAAIDVYRLACKEGWLPNGFGGYVDPTCAKKEAVQAGMAAAVASALTTERARRAAEQRALPRALGLRPAKRDGRTLRLGHYLARQLVEQPPERRDWLAPVTDIGVMGNDVLGDCGPAAAAHFVQVWTANNGQQTVIPDDQVVQFYALPQVGGYVPGDPSTDNGVYLLDMMNAWRQVGIGGHKIAAFVAVDWTDEHLVDLACDLFGGVMSGLQLPLAAQGQEVFAIGPEGASGQGALGSWGGHCIPWFNFGPGGRAGITWGRVMSASQRWLLSYCTEMYAPVSQDWATGTRAAPNGFLLDQLLADAASVSG